MKKYHLGGVLALAACSLLAACSTTDEINKPNQLAQKTVHYECSAQGQRRVNLDVQYTFQGVEPVTAQIIYENQAIELARDTNSKTNLVGNTFTGHGYGWTTGQFTVQNADKVDGNLLTRTDAGAAGASPVNTILARECHVGG